MVCGCSEHVLHCLVVHAFVCGGYDAYVPRLVLVYLLVECGCQRHGERVVVLCLYVVHGVLPQL